MFNPRDNKQIFTVGQLDGIFIWEFTGDTHTDYKQNMLADPREQDLPIQESIKEEPSQSMLEQIRTTNKEKKKFRNQMSDDSFIIP
jgi:hypothetical protein